jgi:hypothetical protein
MAGNNNYDPEEAFVNRRRLPRHPNYANNLYPGGGGGGAVAAPDVNPVAMLPSLPSNAEMYTVGGQAKFANYRTAQTRANLASAAPPILPDTTPSKLEATGPDGREYYATGTLDKPDPARNVQQRMGARNAYIQDHQALADALKPDFVTDRQMASDVNTRANAANAANVGRVNAETQFLVPGQGAALQGEAAVRNAQAAQTTQMLPGQVAAQGIQNKLGEQMIAPTVQQATTNAQNPPGPVLLQQIKDLTTLVNQSKTDNNALRQENARLMQQIRLYQNPGGSETDQLIRGISNQGAAPAAQPQTGAKPTTQPAAQGNGRLPTQQEMEQIYEEAGRNPDRAAQIAASRGFRVTR